MTPLMQDSPHVQSIPHSSAYRRAAGVVLRKVAGETLLIPVRGHVAKLQCLFVLDGVGEVVWELLGEAKPVEQIASDVSSRFSQPFERVLGDCRDFVGELMAEGLVEAI